MTISCLEYIKTYSINELINKYGIDVVNYEDRIILNYNQINSHKYRFDQIVRECRGLILSLPNYDILSRSFDRFFNFGEDPNEKQINFNNLCVDEKLDGSLINVYFDNSNWCCATRKRAFAEGTVAIGKSFKELFEMSIGESLNSYMKGSDPNYTYIFELTSPYNRVVTPYTETVSFLLAVRNKYSGQYIDRNIIAKTFQLKNKRIYTPKEYKFNSFDQLLKICKSLPATTEGYVCREGDYRIKIKNPSYLAISHIRGEGVLSRKRIVFLVFKQEQDEYLSYFPEDKIHFEPYEKAYELINDDILKSWNEFKHIENQKDFAIAIQKSKVKDILFKIKNQNNIKLSEIFDAMTEPAKIRLINNYLTEEFKI